MTTPPDALEPVRTALLDAARADAEATLAEARRAAAAVLDDAHAQAAEILAAARRQGEADGAAAGAAVRMRARRAARAAELAARSETYAQLRHRATAHVRQLRARAEYPAVREELAARARRLLGPDASVVEQSDGGVVATAPGRRVDLSLNALAERALDRMGADAEALWAP